MRLAATRHWAAKRHYFWDGTHERRVPIYTMCAGSPIAGTSFSSPWPPNNEFETDRLERQQALKERSDEGKGHEAHHQDLDFRDMCARS